MTFSEFPLDARLQEAIAALGFEVPTPVQAQTIPFALKGRDVLGCAQTGTGKTLAFLVPTLNKLLADDSLRSVVLVPTRELGQQVRDVAASFADELEMAPPVLLIGGVPMGKQMKALQAGGRILIATPGRLIDHLKHGSVRLDRARLLIIDEADRMLDIGFAPQLNEVLRFMPRERQTLMFTATLAGPIRTLAEKFLIRPESITVGSTEIRAKASIDQKIVEVDAKEKNGTLLDILKDRRGSVLIFARTQHRTDRLSRYLEEYGFSVARLHGGRSQPQRTRALEGFRNGEIQILVATDIAARGLDIDHVGFVVNYDLPQAPEDYVHRVGRTGRAGRTGEALSFITPEDHGTWRAIRRLSGERVETPRASSVKTSSPRQDSVQTPRRSPSRSQEKGGRRSTFSRRRS